MADVVQRVTAALAGRYAIERELGTGGTVTVYLAMDLRHHRRVAVKVLRPDLSATLNAERFVREITVAAALTHPYILPLQDSGYADGVLFYVTPYIEGESLRDRLERDGQLPVGVAVRLLREMVDALSRAHARGVVHGALSADKVILANWHALLTDFGVAKAVEEATNREARTTARDAPGTPVRMVSELEAVEPNSDPRADIYALGALAYEMLTGRPPFAGGTVRPVLPGHITPVPRPVAEYRAGVPPELAQLVMKCLEMEPADRWRNAGELLPHLEALPVSGGTIPATRLAKQRRMNWRLAAIVLLVAGLLAISQRLSF